MQPLPAETSTAAALLPPSTRLGHVHLVVGNLERQIRFYTTVLNLHLHWRQGTAAALGTPDAVLVRLTEQPAARRIDRAAGMYHFALLYPSRAELARAIARLFALRYPNAPTDHGVSKTTYLEDPEGNTIELYVRSLDDAAFEVVGGQLVVRYADGRIGTGRDPLDVAALLRELDTSTPLDRPLPVGTQLGHMHLYVADLDAAMHFYAGVLGFQPGPIIHSFRMGEVGLDAAQPHVVAFNTWKGPGLPPAPRDALGLRVFTIVLPSSDELGRVVGRAQAAGVAIEPTPPGVLVRDPSGIAMLLTDRLLAPADRPSAS